jgi:hypothetical protein
MIVTVGLCDFSECFLARATTRVAARLSLCWMAVAG